MEALNATKKLQINVLGDLRVSCDGIQRSLPKSRKTRALLAYLALSGRCQHRETLCDMFWDTPSDPRAALRWSLSKLRPLLSVGDACALIADQEGVALDSDLIAVDLHQIQRLLAGDRARIEDERLAALEQAFTAGYLTGLDVCDSIDYQMWLASEREAMQQLHALILDERIARLSSAPKAALPLARRLVSLDPLDTAANRRLLGLVLGTGGRKEAQSVLEQMRARYRNAGLPDLELLAAWQQISGSGGQPARVEIELPASVASVPLEPVDSAGHLLVLPDKPSVAVLGFQDLGGHEHGGVLAEGLAADLNSHLAQLSGLFVVARASAVRFADKRDDLTDVGRQLGVRYLIHGTTQRLGRRIRVNVTLIDSIRNEEIWAERFDRSFDDLFTVQDDITSAIVSTVEPEIERAEMERARLKPPDNLNAWECFHRALWHCFRFTAGDAETAHRFLLRALEIDPQFARAHAGLSFTHYSRAFLDSVPDIDREIAQALEYARQSVDLDGRDAMGHWSVGRALFLSRQHDQALEAIDRSLNRNPNFAQGHYARGFIGVHAGIPEDAVPELDMAQRLSPFDPLLFAMKASRAISLAIQGEFDQAAALSVRASHEPNAHFHIYAVAAACLQLAGREEEARNNARWVMNMHPGYSLSVYQRSFPHKHADHRRRMVQALARAGIPE